MAKLPYRSGNLLFAEANIELQKESDVQAEELGLEIEMKDPEYKRAIFVLSFFEGAWEFSDTETNCTFDGEDYTLKISFDKLCQVLKEYYSGTDNIFLNAKN